MNQENRIDPDLSFEYSQITDQIYIGTSFDYPGHKSEKLLQEGINAAISLEIERSKSPLGFEFYSRIPVEDQQSPTRDQFKLGVVIIDTLVEMGKKIYIHCRAGQGRSPVLVAAYFISKGMSFEKAINKIRAKRPIINLEKIQIEGLKEYEASLRK